MPPEDTSSAAPAKGGAPTTSQAPKTSPKSPAPTGGPRATDAPPEAMDAFARAKARRGTGGANTPASDSPAAGLSSGKTAIQSERGLDKAKSALAALKEKSRKFNPNAKPIKSEVVADDAALPGHGPSEVDSVEEPEIEPLAPAPGESEIPADTEGSTVSTPVGNHETEENTDPEDPAVTEDVFTPNLKYKAFGQEHDIPERFQGLITDVESEREVHQVFEKAHAMDRFKANLTQLDQAVKTQLAPEINAHRRIREEFNQLIVKDDIFGILQKMNIPREKVLQAVATRIRIEQLPPEQRAVYEERERAQATTQQAESQLQAMQSKIQNLEALAKHSSIQSTFARGDVRTVADDFDNRVGQPGSFEALVREHGALLYSQGKDITPEEAVQAVMQRFGLQAKPSGTQVTAPVARSAAPARTATATPAKVLPNIASRAAATTRSKIQVNNLADLRKLRAQTRGR